MERTYRLRDLIKRGVVDLFYVFREEFRNVFRDSGVLIFFFLVPLAYPVLYAFIYNKEVVHEAKLVVVDLCDTYSSREFIRRVDATGDVRVVHVCADMREAREWVDQKKAYGILSFPPSFSADLHRGEQTRVSLYCDMSSLLFYKAFLLSATEVSLEMGAEMRARNIPSSTTEMERITIDPIPYDSIALFNPANGFASFLVPAILALVIQQTLILGIGMLGGTARERNRFRGLVPLTRHYGGTLRVVMGRALTYLTLYALVCLWVLWIVPRLFSLPQVGQPMTIVLFVLPYLLACVFFAMTLSGFLTSRESPMLVFVFTSLIFLFISGVSWPLSAIPPFWKAFGYLVPSTPGIQGFIRINTAGATLNEVAHEYRVLWLQAGFYFITSCLVYRLQIILSRRRMLRRYREMRMLRQRRRLHEESRDA